jgi:hypothetical protein
MMKTTTGSQAENPKSVFKRVVAFRPDPARAAAEDATDNARGAEAERIRDRVAREWVGDDPFERTLAVMRARVPPPPPGFRDRLGRCNRCGRAAEYSLESDAHFCVKCNRWLESRCRDPQCKFCSKRPARPVP